MGRYTAALLLTQVCSAMDVALHYAYLGVLDKGASTTEDPSTLARSSRPRRCACGSVARHLARVPCLTAPPSHPRRRRAARRRASSARRPPRASACAFADQVSWRLDSCLKSVVTTHNYGDDDDGALADDGWWRCAYSGGQAYDDGSDDDGAAHISLSTWRGCNAARFAVCVAAWALAALARHRAAIAGAEAAAAHARSRASLARARARARRLAAADVDEIRTRPELDALVLVQNEALATTQRVVADWNSRLLSDFNPTLTATSAVPSGSAPGGAGGFGGGDSLLNSAMSSPGTTSPR